MQVWEADKGVYKLMHKLLRKDHPHLLSVIEEIAIVFREKASKQGGCVILGKSKRAPPILAVLSDRKCQFIIELAADEWKDLTPDQKEALVFHHLCSLHIEEDEKTGDIKYSLLPPDFIGYAAEIKKYGVWRSISGGLTAPSQVEEIFGKVDGKSEIH